MKKLFLAMALLVSGFAHAEDIDVSNNATMKAFYDSFLPGFFSGAENAMIKEGVPKDKIDAYITALKGRLNKQDLINETYPCVSKIPLEKLETEGMNCFIPWFQNAYEKNKDLLDLLL